MTISLLHPHAQGKKALDTIFSTNAAAQAAARALGADKVVNASVGSFLDENEVLSVLPTVERVYKELSPVATSSYAPFKGMPTFLESIKDLVFDTHVPEGFIDGVATPGGTGAIRHAFFNFTGRTDRILSGDWYWGPYATISREIRRVHDTFELFADGQFNRDGFLSKVEQHLLIQGRCLAVLNDPCHNPTGFGQDDAGWAATLGGLRDLALRHPNRPLVLLIDAAYLHYAEDPSIVPRALCAMEDLPPSMMVLIAASVSKSHTKYGMRTGALLGWSQNEQVIREFDDVNTFSCRGTWSNCNRAGQELVHRIQSDESLRNAVHAERQELKALLSKRTQLFCTEAQEVELDLCPFTGGFFLTAPSDNPKDTVAALREQNVFVVAAGRGVRVAICSVPLAKIQGLAGRVKDAVVATADS